jgi:hypothetical protein
MEDLIHQTPESIERFIREKCEIEGEIGGGLELLKYLANYVNGRYVTLDGLRQCLAHDPNIIAPNKLSLNIRKRREMLRKARLSLLSVSRNNRYEEIEDRIIRLEDLVAQLIDQHTESFDWDYQPKPPRRMML